MQSLKIHVRISKNYLNSLKLLFNYKLISYFYYYFQIITIIFPNWKNKGDFFRHILECIKGLAYGLKGCITSNDTCDMCVMHVPHGTRIRLHMVTCSRTCHIIDHFFMFQIKMNSKISLEKFTKILEKSLKIKKFITFKM